MEMIAPNGQVSWLETHHEVVSRIALAMSQDTPCWALEEVYSSQGTKALYTLGVQWTNEFEAAFPEDCWEDLEFMEEVEAFMDRKLGAEN
jgi:hypothetical protein